MTKTQLFRALIALLGIIGVSMQIAKDGFGMLFYYTVLSNILVFCFLIYLVIYEGKHGAINHNDNLLRVKGGVMMSITITFVVYHFMIGPYAKPEDYWNIRNFLVHYIVPISFIFDTVVLDKRKAYKKFDPFYWMAAPILYCIFAIFNGYVTKFAIPGAPDSPYAYWFLNIPKYGLPTIVMNIVGITIGYGIVGYLLFLIKKYVGPKNA